MARMSLRLRARIPSGAAAPAVERDPDILRAFLEDAAHVPGGHAAGVAFPRSEAEVAALVRGATQLLAVGAQSSLTGGATPRGEVVLSTRALTAMEMLPGGRVRAGAGVPLAALQQALAARALYYPPVPTYEGAFVGGTIATNAAGAATFKYGSTRRWVDALTVVLADGSVLDVERGRRIRDAAFAIETPSGGILDVPIPSYRMPDVPKHSAGYHAAGADGYDPIDLFIGSEGTLGVIVSATLRVIRRPAAALALVACADDREALAITAAVRASTDVDVAGVEYADARALALVDDDAFAKAGVRRPASGAVLLFVQIEGSLDAFASLLASLGADPDIQVALPGDDRARTALVDLREAVPAAVNRRVADAKRRVDPAIEKTAGDPVVPFERLAESLALYRGAFERRGLRHAIWGHLSDGNLHPNVIPRSLDDVARGKEAILEIGREVVRMGGSPLAEHGVGRNAVKQELLRQLYGADGIAQMRAVKRALDPGWKLAPGVIFQRVEP